MKQEIDIQDLLVWAYKDQGVDEFPDQISGPKVSLMSWNVHVDGSDTPDEPAADAFIVHSEVKRMSKMMQGLIIGCAKNAEPPPYFSGAKVVLLPMLSVKGKPVQVYDDNRHPVLCKLICAVELADKTIMMGYNQKVIDAARTLYVAWHDALSSMVSSLNIKLEGYQVTKPKIEPYPWSLSNAA